MYGVVHTQDGSFPGRLRIILTYGVARTYGSNNTGGSIVAETSNGQHTWLTCSKDGFTRCFFFFPTLMRHCRLRRYILICNAEIGTGRWQCQSYIWASSNERRENQFSSTFMHGIQGVCRQSCFWLRNVAAAVMSDGHDRVCESYTKLSP